MKTQNRDLRNNPILNKSEADQFIDLVQQYSKLDDAGRLYINGAIAMASVMAVEKATRETINK